MTRTSVLVTAIVVSFCVVLAVGIGNSVANRTEKYNAELPPAVAESDDVRMFRDEARGVTCWLYQPDSRAAGISCLRDAVKP